jgi:O-antigen/teichoic acid export membrane protein
LTQKLPITTYSAWILILQMSACVGYLDPGVQSGVAKFVAEYEARGDAAGANQRASAGLAIMLGVSILGVLMTLILAWQVPRLFHAMPRVLDRDVRISVLFVGISLSFGLFCSIFIAIFVGLQRYVVPVLTSIAGRVLFTAVVCGAVFRHSSLAMMGALTAVVNVAIGIVQIVAWRRYAARIRVSLLGLDYGVVKKMLSYCWVLAIWSAGMLCVNGLDVAIVGRYDFSQTAFYSVATLPATFIISILLAALHPLLPVTSAMSTFRTPTEMGSILSRTTRYSTLVLVTCGLFLMVAAYPILRLWVGPEYATNTVLYLRILVIANVLRNLCAPYSTMLVAMDRQKVAIAGVVAEAAVNVAASIYFAKHFGAVGVAYGTLLGSVVSMLMHFAVSMHYTSPLIAISRARLLVDAILRPLLIAIPSLVLVQSWWSVVNPTFSAATWIAWAASTLIIAWFAGLNGEERTQIRAMLIRSAPQRPRSA